MRRSRLIEEQIIRTQKEHQAGRGVAELCRKYGICDATSYKWRSKFGGLEPSEARRLRRLEVENATLKRLLAVAMLDVSTLRRCRETYNAEDTERATRWAMKERGHS